MTQWLWMGPVAFKQSYAEPGGTSIGLIPGADSAVEGLSSGEKSHGVTIQNCFCFVRASH